MPMVASKQSSHPSPSVSGHSVVVGIDVGAVVVAVVVVVGVGATLHSALISSGTSTENDHSACLLPICAPLVKVIARGIVSVYVILTFSHEKAPPMQGSFVSSLQSDIKR